MNFKRKTKVRTNKSKMFKSENKVDTWCRMIHKWWLRNFDSKQRFIKELKNGAN